MTQVLLEERSLLTLTVGGVHMEEVPSLGRTSLRYVFLLSSILKLICLSLQDESCTLKLRHVQLTIM